MAELFIFSPDDELLTIITEDTGLISAPVRIEINQVSDTPFSFMVEAESEEAAYVKEENKVVYRDHEGDLRIAVIKEIDDSDGTDGPLTEAICEPEFLELNEHVIEDRRFVDKTAQEALDAALNGTRYTGEVEVDLGLATTNFYYITALEALAEILNVWGGEFKDVVEFDEQNNITSRKIKIIQRLGKDTGQRFEVDHNITEIGRTVISYPLTAMYGRGASLEIEDEDGNHTGGYSRYIDFADVEWKKSKGDPVDKPLGQRWVGDPEALKKYGRIHNGQLLHRTGIFSNQDYEDPADLLMATWQHLQDNNKPVVNYRLSVDLFDDKVSLGDTAIVIDRNFARPIEIQSRVIAMEYDLLDIDGTMVVEMGQHLNLRDDRLDNVINEVERIKQRPAKVTRDSFPDRKPPRPVNVQAVGAFQTIQLYWDFADTINIKHYEVYGSQVADFVPDSQHLLWRGQVSAFAHTVNTDETWYYYVRAVNYHGTPSDWSERVSASTARIINDDILFGEIVAEHLADNLDIAEKLAQNTIDRINEEPIERISGLESDMTAVRTTIDQMPDQINLAVSEGIDGLEIGGRNLILNSDEEVVIDNTYRSWNLVEKHHFSDRGIDYVLSFEGRADNAGEIVRPYTGGGIIVTLANIELTTEWKRYSVVVKLPSGDFNQIRFHTGGYGGATNFRGEFRNLKLEKGNKATDWTPAPEDQVNKTNVLSSINLSTEGVRIQGERIHLTGQTLIDDGIIGTAAIADAAISRAKLGRAIINDLHVDEITGDKIRANTINADHLNVTNLGAITANLGTVKGGHITQESSGRRLEMWNGEIESYSLGKLAMKFGGYSLDFYNTRETLLGQIVPLINESNSSYEGLGIIVENDFINIGMRQGGYIRPVLRSSFYDKNTVISGPYSNANDGASLRLYGNRRLVSSDRFSSVDQPSIHLDQSDETNNITMYYGGWGRRTNASVYFRHRVTASSWVETMRIAPNYVRIYDQLRIGSANNPSGIYPYANSIHWRYDVNNYIRQQSNGRVEFYAANNMRHGFSSSGDAEHTGDLHVGNYIWSPRTYNDTTTNSANMHVFSGTGRFVRSASSRRYKLLEEPIKVDPYKLLSVQPKDWYDKNEVEKYADQLTKKHQGKNVDLSNIEMTKIRRVPGLIAEDVEAAGLDPYVDYNENGQVEGLKYDRLWTLLIPITKDHNDDITWLKTENQLLKNEIKILKNKVNQLEEQIT